MSDDDEVIFQENVLVSQAPCTLTLYSDRLVCTGQVKKCIIMDDIVSARPCWMPANRKKTGTIIHSLPKKGEGMCGNAKRKREDWVFMSDGEDSARRWVDLITARAYKVPPGELFIPPRLKIVLNPVSGTKKATKILDHDVVPLLQVSDIPFEIYETKHQNHAAEMSREFRLDPQRDIIVSVSGDGIVHEIVNGLMSRDDWSTAIKTPLGLIPAGSGNGMAYAIGVGDVICAVHTILKGRRGGMDLISMLKGGVQKYLFQFASYGMVSDVDRESEAYRWMGDTRFVFSAAMRVFFPRLYSATVHYLPASNADNLMHLCKRSDCEVCVGATHSTDRKGKRKSANAGDAPVSSVVDVGNRDRERHILAHCSDEGKAPHTFKSFGSNWKTMSGQYAMISAMNIPYFSKDLMMCPFAHVSDGTLDLCWSTTGDRMKNLSAFVGLEKGNHVKSSMIGYEKIVGLTIIPTGKLGKLDVDGEFLDMERLHIDVLPHLAVVMKPQHCKAPPGVPEKPQ